MEGSSSPPTRDAFALRPRLSFGGVLDADDAGSSGFRRRVRRRSRRRRQGGPERSLLRLQRLLSHVDHSRTFVCGCGREWDELERSKGKIAAAVGLLSLLKSKMQTDPEKQNQTQTYR